jgi:hypothetical protein
MPGQKEQTKTARKDRVTLTKAAAFEVYCGLGHGRTLVQLEAKLVEMYGRESAPSAPTLKRWGQQGRWRSRVEGHDTKAQEKLGDKLAERAAKAQFDHIVELESVAEDAIRTARQLLSGEAVATSRKDDFTPTKLLLRPDTAQVRDLIDLSGKALDQAKALREVRSSPGAQQPGGIRATLKDMPSDVLAAALAKVRVKAQERAKPH